MDTSKTYIKMCEKAGEIQKPMPCIEDGDYYWWSTTGKVQLSYTEYHADYKVHHPEQWDWLSGRRIIWLPRQDQLQEMVTLHPILNSSKSKIASLLARFWEWYLNTADEFTTVEQLWLAFVMKERWNKTWNGEDWT